MTEVVSFPVKPAEKQAPQGLESLEITLLKGLRRLRRARNEVVLEEAKRVLLLSREGAAAVFGFSSFHDFARERLGLSSRTASRRVRLARLLERHSKIREAFLSGDLTACQALALAPVAGSESIGFWIRRARSLGVRELEAALREESPGEEAPRRESESVRVAFPAPLSVHLNFDRAVTLARQTLGFDAPRYQCLEAMLAEAEAGLPVSGGEADGDEEASQPAAGRGPDRSRFAPPAAVPPPVLPRRTPLKGSCERAHANLRLLDRELHALCDLLEGSANSDTLVSLRALSQVERPLRLLQSRLLRDLVDTRSLERLGFEGLHDFAERELKLSERSAYNLLREARCFDDEPQLETAFVRGAIGLGQALLIQTVMTRSTCEAWLARAQAITVQQLEREVELIHRALRLEAVPPSDYSLPFPDNRLEDRLRERLRLRGFDENDLLDLRKRFLSEEQVAAVFVDPATNPAHHRWLCALLDALYLEEAREEDQMIERYRALFARRLNAEPVSGEGGRTGSVPDPGVDRGAATANVGALWAPAYRRFHIQLPRPVFQQWVRVSRALQAAGRTPLPPWAVLALVLQAAISEWETSDPATRPRETPVYRRDEYQCQAPGCSRRSNLEAHHIIYRSRGGTDDLSNKVTLCSFHHRQGEHDGRLTVRGRAPAPLYWSLGDTVDRPHWKARPERYIGSKRLI